MAESALVLVLAAVVMVILMLPEGTPTLPPHPTVEMIPGRMIRTTEDRIAYISSLSALPVIEARISPVLVDLVTAAAG